MSAPKRTIARARRLRQSLTPPEARLWVALRPRPGGHKFRRQHPIESYVLDFYCDAARLAIEVDGWSHDMGDVAARDLVRDAWLGAQGIAVLRILAEDVRVSLSDVVDTIVAKANERIDLSERRWTPSTDLRPVPLPQLRGGGDANRPERGLLPIGGSGRRAAPDE